ncbi:hypothetical protein IAU60_002663 [Kwoniella sp. DSM 27419]
MAAAVSSAATAGPSTSGPSTGVKTNGQNAGRARHLANQKKYGNPLPILPPQPPTYKGQPPSVLSSYISSLSPSSWASSSKSKIEVPQAFGTFDPITRSVWVEDEYSKDVLFCRGFFGKGSLSRSEPSWRERRVGLLKGGATLAAEQMREKRRLERKQFKIDRAQAMLEAAKQAEAIITAAGGSSSQAGTPGPSSSLDLPSELGQRGETAPGEEVDEGLPERSGSPTPSTKTSAPIDPTSLTAQTFLVRPTRPDATRNRGRKAFRRRPPPAAGPGADGTATATAPAHAPAPVPEPAEEEIGVAEEDLFDESIVEDMEHLQLSLEEAIFLSLGLGVLKVMDPFKQSYPPFGPSLLSLFLTPPSMSAMDLSTPTPMLPDDPVLVSYVAYHHFRSIGWVVKDGIKFCCDWLLYRRGPVFSHSAFACVVIPVYDDERDQASSPYGNEDWYEERMSWKWMNTIMRVNALVQKTVIAVYVTIPALSSFPKQVKLDNGALDPRKNDLASLLSKYTVREVSMTRFGASRRRD